MRGVGQGSWAMCHYFCTAVVGLRVPPMWALYIKVGACEVCAEIVVS